MTQEQKDEAERLAPMLEELQDYTTDENDRKIFEDTARLLRSLLNT